MDAEQLATLKRMMAEIAIGKALKRHAKRGERVSKAPFGPAEARLTWEACAVCKCPVNALEGFRRDDGRLACPTHVSGAKPLTRDARALCSHCHVEVASGVWEYGGTAFGHAWRKLAALCAACGFSATNWTVFAGVNLPKWLTKGLSKEQLRRVQRKLPDGIAVRYVQWCRLVESGRAAAGRYAESVQAAVDAAVADVKAPVLFDMSDPEAAWRFLQAHKIGQR